MKLLIIEDNRTVARSLKAKLAKEHVVELASRPLTSFQRIASGEYGVIIVDLCAPEENNRACRELRRAGYTVPVLVLGAKNDVEARVTLLRNGADDYLAKPFHIDELKARINALGRRRDAHYVGSLITFKDLVMDLAAREVARSGIKISLRRKEFDILEYLISNRGRAVSREMIINNVWGSSRECWRNTVDVHIKHLRDKIDRPFETTLIKTEYGIGYMVEDDDPN